ncbi:MAG: ThuA domain-containing protein [Planctomycetota bacterium]
MTDPSLPPAEASPAGWVPPSDGRRQRVLYFTRTAGFEHSAVARSGGKLSHSEQVLTAMGSRAGFEVECSKDGRIFDTDLTVYDAIAFYTLGDLLRADRSTTPPMSSAGKERLLELIAEGMPFVGFHSATDTFYGEGIDPYIRMMGAEFCGHGLEQEAAMLVKSPLFPGMQGLAPSFRMYEEWYVFKKVCKEMHVILALDTRAMHGNLYDRPPTPATWARMHGKGRVFYTSLGHREEVWLSPVFQQIAYGGLAWALGNARAEIPHNFDQATPGGDQYRPVPLEPGCVSR